MLQESIKDKRLKKRILLFNDNSKRDLLGVRLLEEALKKQNFITKICNPDTWRVMVNNFRPHGFVASRADHSNPARDISKLAKVFIVPGEGAQLSKDTMLSVFMGRGYYKMDDVSFITRCYLWNENTYNWLMDTKLFDSSQLTVTGNPRIDIYRDKELMNALKAKKDSDFTLGVGFSAKSTSGYSGPPKWPQTYFDFHRETTFSITVEGGNHEDVSWRDHIILRKMMGILKLYLENSTGKIILRPSPFEDINEFIFLKKRYPERVLITNEQPLPEYLCEIDAILTCWSTMGIEGLILDLPVISLAGAIDQEKLFNHISFPRSGFDTFVPFYHQPESDEAIISLIEKIKNGEKIPNPMNEDETQKLLDQMYNWNSKISACELIAKDIQRVLENSQPRSKKEWKKEFPIPYNIPMIAAPFANMMRNQFMYFKSGSYKSFYGFRRTNDPRIESLIKMMKK